jgi:hypothetical protein
MEELHSTHRSHFKYADTMSIYGAGKHRGVAKRMLSTCWSLLCTMVVLIMRGSWLGCLQETSQPAT